VNAAAIALMAGVTLQLPRDAVIDPLTATVAIAVALLLLVRRVNSNVLVLFGALIGLAFKGFGG
jgi:chromate transporter